MVTGAESEVAARMPGAGGKGTVPTEVGRSAMNDRRKHERIPYEAEVTVQFAPEEEHLVGRTMNIGYGGTLIQFPVSSDVRVGTECTLQVNMPHEDGPKSIQFTSKVIHTGVESAAGVAFLAMKCTL